VQLNARFCCLWHHVEAYCHKHFVVFSRNQHRRLLPAMCHNLRHAGRALPATVFTTPACCSVNLGSQARYMLIIVISAYPTCLPHRQSSPVPFGAEKLEWCGYPTVKKLKISLFVLTQCTNVTDTHIHRHTPHDGIGRAYA